MRILCLFLLASSILALQFRRRTLGAELMRTTTADNLKPVPKLTAPATTTRISSNNERTRRSSLNVMLGIIAGGSLLPKQSAVAVEIDTDPEELEALYDNPAMPEAPEERSGLVVLRVAEVAQFQEKILRGIVAGDLEGIMVSPMQFVFGTQILLRNSNLDGNMKLMIGTEIERKYRKKAVKNCVNALNTLQYISSYAGSIQRDFKPEEMMELADMYRDVRINLNELYEYLPPKEREKYYGYFVEVTEYEKKIAEGTYNPDIDGKLNFDY